MARAPSIIADSENYPMRSPATRVLVLMLALGTAPTWAQTLAGASDGLYRVEGPSRATRLLSGVEVKKIVRAGDGFYFMTSRGVLYSRDLAGF